MKKKFKKHYTLYTLIITLSIAFSTCVYTMTRKIDIDKATIKQIEEVHDIGPVIAHDIYFYIQSHEIKSVKQLKNEIPYLGEKRLKELNKKFK